MNKGIQFALLTAVISGFAVFISKVAVTITDPIVHVVLRTSLVALSLSIVMQLRGKLSGLKQLKKKEVWYLILIGVIGGSLPFLLFFIGLSQTSAATGNMIQKTLYIWVALLAVPLLHEKLNPRQALGYGLILLSNIAIGIPGFTGNVGERLIFMATILWAIEHIIAKKALQSIDSLTVAWARMTIGSTILILTALVMGKGNQLLALTPAQYGTLFLGGTTLFFYVLTWYKALSLSPATQVSSVLVLATPITTLLSALFITHKLPSPELTNGILTLAGVGIIILFAKDALKLSFWHKPSF